MAVTEFSSTSMYFPESAVAASGRSGGVSTLTGRRGRGGRAAALTSTLVVMMAVVVAMMLVLTTSPAMGATAAWKVLAGTAPTHLAPYENERQVVNLQGGSAGTFTLTFAGDTTAPIAKPGVENELARAADIAAALNALPSISAGGGSVTVRATRNFASTSAPRGSDYVVSFDGGPLAGTDVPLMSGAVAGGGSITVAAMASGLITVSPANMGGVATTSAPIVVEAELPPGITGLATDATATHPTSCSVAGQHMTCTRTGTPVRQTGQTVNSINMLVAVGPGAQPQSVAEVTVHGAGATPATVSVPVKVSSEAPAAGLQAIWAGAFDADGLPYTQAGGHPVSAGAAFLVNTRLSQVGDLVPVGDIRDLHVDPPAGFVGNPLVVPYCLNDSCGDRYVGYGLAIYDHLMAAVSYSNPDNLNTGQPRRGAAARFWFQIGTAEATAVAALRPDDFGVRVTAPTIPTTYRAYAATTTLLGTPPGSGGKAFLTNPTQCTGQLLPTYMSASTWQQPLAFSDPVADWSPAVTACALVPFDPVAKASPTSTKPDSAGGLEFDVEVPQEGLLDPNQIAQSHVDDVTVDLPVGIAVNPSGATGLKGCSDAEMAPGTTTAPACPDGSKLGTVEVTSPLVDHPIGGTMYLGTPKSTDPMSGEMLRLWVVARDDQTGTMVKLPGSATADPTTGKLTATFKDNPRVPFDHLSVKLRGGDRGLLAMPQTCNTEPDQYESVSSFTPWSRSHLPEGEGDGRQDPVEIRQSWTVDGDCAYGFDPGLKAGMSNAGAREGGTFGFEFTRPQGDQTLKGLTAELPTGLLATVKDLPLCKDAQAAAGNCPAASRIGLVDASAGSGDPFVLEKKGEIFLTEGYKGGPYGLMVKVRAIAGPFRGDMELSPIIVRQKIEVDPTTAQVKAISDPFPTIWHGVPLRVRRVLVKIDRDNFMVNPSDCSAKQVRASLTSSEGTRADLANHFQARGCAALPFGPKISMRNLDKGRRSTVRSWNPRMRFVVRQQGVGEAGISGARVTLPSSVILDQSNLDTTCTRAQMAAEDCPAGSVVGYARAFSPLLNRPVQGPVYLAANGGARPLPDVTAVLDGEIRVALTSWIDTVRRGGKGRLRSTFNVVPDAPVSRFVLTMRGGKNRGLLVNSTDLCRTKERAVANFSGHNGKRSSSRPRIGLRFKGCKRARKQIARRAVKRKIARKKARAARVVARYVG